ncbi:MAG TPA: HAMP domain-containing sensor histidine kinase, partial [Haloferula sp.]
FDGDPGHLAEMQSEGSTPTAKLGDFILENMGCILSGWEDFAREIWDGPLPSVARLRDDAEVMLRALVTDMAAEQTSADRKFEPEVGKDRDRSGLDRAAMGHALARINDGFDIRRIIAEFRALRASVIRIWANSSPISQEGQTDDMTRFNEAIDQLIAASVNAFIERIELSRRLFLGILGHDLRQPLFSIKMFTEVLLHPQLPSNPALIVSRIRGCCDGMVKMLANLLDFTSAQLGCPMPIHLAPCDSGAICGEVVEEVQASTSVALVRYEASGDLSGEWDATRLRELVSNLLMNAIQHGELTEPITATMSECGDEVILTVHNIGPTIPQAAIKNLFDPMVRLAAEEKPRPHGSIGLGLYICRQVALAHGGGITVDSSSQAGTTFTVRLPKQPVHGRIRT